jgi:hypothetical protein
MHGEDDDGYPVAPQPGFAPFTVMRQRHVPWADERLRGSYYQRAWQSLAARYMGVRHVVQPNTFTLQLPHTQAFSNAEAAVTSFLAVSCCSVWWQRVRCRACWWPRLLAAPKLPPD